SAVAALVPNIQLASARAAYYTACLETTLPAGFELVEKAAVGLTTKAADDVFCSGVLVDNRTLLTAKHCFFDYRTGQPTDEWSLLRSEKLEITSSAGRFAVQCGDGTDKAVRCNRQHFRPGFALDDDYL